MGAYAETARRRIHLATVLFRPTSGHRPGRRQRRHTETSDGTTSAATTTHAAGPSTWTSQLYPERIESSGRGPT